MAATIRQVLSKLRGHYGSPEPPPAHGAFELVLWENVAYLAKPAKRLEAFELLAKTIGTKPKQILAARLAALERVTAKGILGATFASKLRECARIAVEELGGDVEAIARGPLDDAKRALRKFPGIGEPGAEKILLLAGLHPLLAPDSNALRVLVRLGMVTEQSSYARTYSASRGVARGLPNDVEAVREAHLLLQLHGRSLCKDTKPRCGECPLESDCPFARRY